MLQNRSPFLLLLIVVNFVTSCKQERPPVLKELSIVALNSALRDSTYISQITDLAFAGTSLVAADHARGQLFTFDLNLQHRSTYGAIGTHRGKFQSVSLATVDGDSIYALNGGGQAFEVFGRPDTISSRTVIFPKAFKASLVRTDFIRTNGRFYVSAPKSGNSVLVCDDNGKTINQFGELFKQDGKDLPSLQNSRILFRSDDNKILAVADTRPIVEEFDPDGKLIFSANLDQEYRIRKNLEAIKSKKNVPGEFYILYRDAYYDKGYLYLLSNVIGEQESSNEVIQCFVTKDGLQVKQRFKLPGTWYWCLAVIDNDLFAYEATVSQIQKFKL